MHMEVFQAGLRVGSAIGIISHWQHLLRSKMGVTPSFSLGDCFGIHILAAGTCGPVVLWTRLTASNSMVATLD
jgi:hypothetical protein